MDTITAGIGPHLTKMVLFKSALGQTFKKVGTIGGLQGRIWVNIEKLAVSGIEECTCGLFITQLGNAGAIDG